MLKKCFALLLSLLVVFSYAQPAVQAEGDTYNITFIDINVNFWGYDAINNMVRQGVISGYPDKTFRPEQSISRQEFAGLISKTFNLDLTSPEEPTFTDVQPDAWSYRYVEAAQEFLTGYYPPSGRPFFDPEAKATREDVAVALVKAMGFVKDDLEDPYILDDRFYDVDEISPKLREYVAIAVEQKLVSGYPDQTFRAQQSISRAEVAALLYKVIKSAATDGTTGPTLKVSVPQKTTTGTFYVTGSTAKGAKVTINDEEVEVIDGKFNEGFYVEEEGEYELVIIAKTPGSKPVRVVKTIIFELDGPKVTFKTKIPESTTTQELEIRGEISDALDDDPELYLNDELVESWYGTFDTTVMLEEGANELVFRAVNDSGKETVITKTVQFNSGGPEIKFDYLPDVVNTSQITITGKITDKNDSNPKLYLNDQQISHWGSFSKTVTLKDGVNTLVFRAVNELGKTTVITRTVTLNADGPELKVNELPTSTDKQTLLVSGSFSDENDHSPKLYLNDELLSEYGSFSKTITLKEGENVLVFKVVNKYGKATTITKVVTMTSGAPTLTIDMLPEATTSERVRISGRVSDTNDSYPKIYLNDEVLSEYGSFSKEIVLKEGDNQLVFKAVNKLGKSVTITKNILFVPEAPALTVDYLPETVNSETLRVTARTSDKNDSYPKIYLNDQLVAEYGSLSKEVKLVEGENTLVFKSINKYGKETTVVKKVTYTKL